MPGEAARAPVTRGLRSVEEAEEVEEEEVGLGAGVSSGFQGRPSAEARSLSRYCAAKWVLYCSVGHRQPSIYILVNGDSKGGRGREEHDTAKEEPTFSGMLIPL